MQLPISLYILLLESAIPVLSVSIPSPTANHGIILPRATETTNKYDPQITIHVDIPTISIPPVTIPPVSIPSLTLDLPTNICTPTVAPDKNGWVPASECNALYAYYPSFGAAIALSALFGITMITHFAQVMVYKTKFVWVILMGATWECAGFVTRAASTRYQQDVTLATITQLFILLSPLWVNAFDYMVLARLIHFFTPDHPIGIFKPSLLALIFVILDIGSFIIQLIGGGMAATGNPPEQIKKGINIYMAGIGIQEFFILIFLIIAIQFHRKMLHLDRIGLLVDPKTKWRKLLYALYISLFFITVRIVFRLVEFSAGSTSGDGNPILRKEWFVYVFDAVPMLLAVAVWNVVHPGTVLRGPEAVLPSTIVGRVLSGCCRRRRDKDGTVGEGSGGIKAVEEDMMPLRGREGSAFR